MDASDVISIAVSEEHYPRYHESHGTPDPMVRRTLSVRTPQGSARFEQTDYGHPGRFNDWEPRGIDPKLQPRTEELRALCAVIGKFL